jgi:hypothetical protein
LVGERKIIKQGIKTHALSGDNSISRNSVKSSVMRKIMWREENAVRIETGMGR